jgi:hypothetical protein
LSLLRDVDVITAAREEATALTSDDAADGGSGLASYPALSEWVNSLHSEDHVDYLEKS